MVEVTILKRDADWIGFKAEGHAAYAAPGEDIYCAGVSAVTQTALLGLMKHLRQMPVYEIKDGCLHCFLPANLSREDRQKANVILSTMEMGLRSMQEAYPQYVKVSGGGF
ncbi:MAG TPA: ribosomal-processing cysteine protease Prp [Syntrophomonadaceae bacterium]|nr:ribosomal-processing cysteine protease Prp [Syntrophomonadaceae bacterium]